MRPSALIAVAVLLLAGCTTAANESAGPPAGSVAPTVTTAAPATVPTSSATGPTTPASKPKAQAIRPKTIDAGAATQPMLTLVSEPEQGIAIIDNLLASPQHSLDLTMYELVDTTAESVLASDAARGVIVRVILDRNREGAANTPAYDYLAARGVHVRWAPTSFEATHEKAAVIDAGQVDARALIMTLNLTSRYYSATRDFAVIDSYPADVAAIEAVFQSDYADMPVVAPAGADLVWSPGSEPGLVALIASARSTLAVENEEMGSSAVIAALIAAASRGVNVEVTMTSDSEWDQAFAELAAAGVHVHVYRDAREVLYIHAKVIIADGHTAFVGSENFSDASLDNNRELGIITASPALVSRLATVMAADYAGATTAQTTTPAPAAVPVTAVSPSARSCHPLTDGGNCYKEGEYCRDDDHGIAGVAGSGENITCKETRGIWEWLTS